MKAFILSTVTLFLIFFNRCKPLYEINLPTQPTEATSDSLKLNGKPVYTAQAKFVSEEAYSNFKEVGPNRIVLSSLRGIKAIGGEAKSGRVAALANINVLKVGDILVAGSFEKFKSGFLIEVTSVIHNGEEWVIEYTNAALTQLFKRVDFAHIFNVEIPLPQLSLEPKLPAIDKFGKEILVSIPIKGSLEYRYKNVLAVRIIESDLQYLSLKSTQIKSTRLTVGAKFDVESILNKEFRYNWKCAEKSIRVVVPPGIPIIINFDVVTNLYVRPALKAVSFEVVLINSQAQTTTGYFTDDEQLENWKPLTIPEYTESPKPTINGAIEGYLQAGIRNEAHISFYFNDFDCDKNATERPKNAFTVASDAFARAEGKCSTDKGLELRIVGGHEASFSSFWPIFGQRKDFTITPDLLKTEKEHYKGTIFDFCKEDTPAPLPNNTELTPVATSTGDPHLRTFDRTPYSFQAVGEFAAVRSTATSNNFEIQVRQEPQPGSTQVSLNTGLAIRTGSDVVCAYPTRVYLNGQNLGVVTDERSLPSGGRLVGSSGRLTIQTAQGDQVSIRFFGANLDYDLTMVPARRGQVRGLFGNYDGNGADDLLRGDNGQSISNEFAELYPNYANSWRIKQSESLFVYDAGKNTETYTDLSYPREPVNLTAQQRTAAEAVCRAAGVTDPQALNNCIIDVALTNNRQFADRALNSQLTTSALNAFSIGEFSTSDVQLEYYKASTTNRAAVLDTRNGAPSVVLMKQGVNMRRGFSTEFSFSTAELDQSSCFFLAFWPTDIRTRSESQNRVGFCFGFMDGMPVAFGQWNLSGSTTTTGRKQVPNFIDGRIHKVRIVERSEPTNTGRLYWFVDVFLDDLKTPVYSYQSPTSTADIINTTNGVGYIEFQINQGSPSRVQLFNWQYNTL